MTSRWRWQVAWLLAWSRPFRGLLILVCAATTAVIATTMCISQLSLSPQQQAALSLGSTQAKVMPIANVELVPSGDRLVLPDWVGRVEDGVTVIPVLHGSMGLSVNEASIEEAIYNELALPSPVLEGNVELTTGRWPTTPGECVSTMSATGQARPPMGEWSLTIVGQVRNVFYPSSNRFYCALGTWETWNLTPSERQTNQTAAMADYFLLGDMSAVSDEITALTAGDQSRSFWVDTRWATLSPKVSSNKFLGDRAPLLVLPFGLALVLAGRLARWSGAVSRVLVRVGVSALQMRRTMTLTMLAGTVTASLAGGLVGAVIAFAARPVLTWSKGGRPLSNWQIPTDTLLLVLAVCVIGVWLGGRVGDAVVSVRLGQQDRPPRPLTTSTQITWAVLGAVTGGVALWLILASQGRLWWMFGGALAMVAAFAAVTPILVGRLGSALSRRPVSAPSLAGRILVENSRRWSIITVSLAAVLGLMCSVFVIFTTAIAGQVLLEASSIPAGSVLIEARNPGGDELPEAMLQRFEEDLGLTNSPVVLTEVDVNFGSGGSIQTLVTMEDVETLLGELPNDAVEILEQGGVAVIGMTTSETTMLAEPIFGRAGQPGTMVPVVSIRPDQAHRYTTGAGFALAPAFVDRVGPVDTIRVWFVYQGLTHAQDMEARQWSEATGMNAFQIDTYYPSGGFWSSLPVWLAVSLIGFGLLLAPLMVLVLRFDIRALVPLAATLKKIGLPKAWVRPVFTTLTGTVTSLAALTALVPALITGVLLNFLYPTIFDFGGAPWWMLAGFLGGILAATLIATQSSMRKLTKKEQVVTI